MNTQPCVAGCGDIGDSATQIPQRGEIDLSDKLLGRVVR